MVVADHQNRPDVASSIVREWFDRDSDDPVRDGLRKLKEPTPQGVALRERLYDALELKNKLPGSDFQYQQRTGIHGKMTTE